jgi:hypothetical protein
MPRACARRLGALAGAFGLCLLAACGGRSFRSDEDGAAGAENPAANPGVEDGGARPGAPSCAGLCGDFGACASDFCDVDCANLELVARESGCATPFSQLVGCLWNEDASALCVGAGACAREVNAFTVCIIDYCDRRPSQCYGI